jgi:hypothetical protein
MVDKKIKKFIVPVLSIFFSIVALSSCGDFNSSSSDAQGLVSHDGSNLSVDFTVPHFLTFAVIAGLQCHATIDGGAPHPLTVDPVTNAASGTISSVSAGNHVLGLKYFVSILGVDVILCKYSGPVTVYANQTTTVTVLDTDLDRNIDDDQDGYTNLAEVRVGTDPLDPADFPAGESPYVLCGNGTTGFASSADYNASVVVGSTVAGSASSTDYWVIVTYSGY